MCHVATSKCYFFMYSHYCGFNHLRCLSALKTSKLFALSALFSSYDGDDIGFVEVMEVRQVEESCELYWSRVRCQYE